jgi:hypothetical protein
VVEVVALVVALVLVPITGGSYKRLARLEFEAPWLLFAGLGIQIVISATSLVPASRADDVGFALLLASYVLILAFGVLNLRVTGMTVITIGIALNVLVIALNQGMPYVAPQGSNLETTVKHRPERENDVLTVLDDHIDVPGPLGESVSYGDLIIAVGIVDLAFRGSRRARRSSRTRSSDPDGRAGSDVDVHLDLVAVETQVAPRVTVGVNATSTASAQPSWPMRAPWHSDHPTLRTLDPPPAPGEVAALGNGAYRNVLRSLRSGGN